MIHRVLLVLVGMLCLAGLILYNQMLSHLKRFHKNVWEGMGSPHLIFNNSLLTSRRVNKFISGKEYLVLEDEKLTKLCVFYDRFSKSYLVLFFVAAVVLVFF